MKLNLVEPNFLDNETIGKFPVLDTYSLRQLAPSFFSEITKNKMLDFSEVIDIASEKGWKPVYAVEKPSKQFKRQGYSKAFIKFRNENMQLSANEDLYPEVLMRVNPVQNYATLDSGYLFRQVCSNGLVRAQDQQSYNIRGGNADFKLNSFERAFEEVNTDFGKILLPVNQMKEIELNETQKFNFATKAKDISKLTKVSAVELLTPRRIEDEGSVLWNVFNRVQENVMSNLSSGLHVELNQQLWKLAEQYA